MIDGTERWCQGFSEPGAGSDLASLTTTATLRRGRLRRSAGTRSGPATPTSPTGACCWPGPTRRLSPAQGAVRVRRLDAPARHRAAPAADDQRRDDRVRPGPLRRGDRVPADQLVGAPGEGWALAMTVVGHEREPAELGYSARYGKLVRDLAVRVDGPPPAELAWAVVQAEMLRLHVRRRLSERLDGVAHGPEGSLDKLLMTWVEQSVGHAALAVAGTDDPELLERLPLQPGAERHGRHLADPEEHHRRADSRPGRPDCVRHAGGDRRPGRRSAADCHAEPAEANSTRSTTPCTPGWPGCGRS